MLKVRTKCVPVIAGELGTIKKGSDQSSTFSCSQVTLRLWSYRRWH